MRALWKRFLGLALSLSFVILSVGCGQSVTSGTVAGDLVFYDLSDGTWGVGVNAEQKDAVQTVAVPSHFEGRAVTRVVGEGFANCSRLSDVVLPSSVIAVDSYAFFNCTALSSIALPDTLTSIGSYAFSGCGALKNVTVPNSVINVGTYAFSYCTGLEQIRLSESLSVLSDFMFYGCASLTLVDVPDSVISLGNGTFQNCGELARVMLGRGLMNIGENTFFGCRSIAAFEVDSKNAHYLSQSGILYNKPVTEIVYTPPKLAGDIVFPNGVTELAASLFADTVGITSVTIPDSMTMIGAYAFSKCSTLMNVYFETPERWTAIYANVLLSETELSDSARAATYLRDTYAHDRWLKGNQVQ